MTKKEQEQTTDIIPVIAETKDIKSLIYVVRGQQVMMDSDLAMLYQVDTKVFNQAVSRKGVLRSDVAIQVSIRIMNTFVEMRRFIANNALLFEKVSDIELKQLEYQKSTDEKFDKVFKYIEDHAESEQKIFFDGQIYDAFSLITSIIQKAQKEIILIDSYVDIDTLNILAKKNAGVDVKIYTYASAQLTNRDAANFNAQYPILTVKRTQVFHDRFIILDGKTAYHIGASIKDAGKKCFGISLINDSGLVAELLKRLSTV